MGPVQTFVLPDSNQTQNGIKNLRISSSTMALFLAYSVIYCPQTKGKIENTIGYVKREFFLGGHFTSIADINSQAITWLMRIVPQVS